MAGISGVLETVLYFFAEEETRAFYADIMGMRLIGREPGRHMFFRAGTDVFLLFNSETTSRAGTLPSHGARGSGHVCFSVPASEYGEWRQHLVSSGVEIIQEVDWPLGAPDVGVAGSSFYFRDPNGNLLEIANADFWPK